MPEKKVLIVDDDSQLVVVMQARLTTAGYDTTVAFDGEQALRQALHVRPDLIVLDVRMPQMDGLTVLGRLRRCAETREIPVIMLSASLPDRRMALHAGARFFLAKPYDGQELLRAVRTVLDGEPVRP